MTNTGSLVLAAKARFADLSDSEVSLLEEVQQSARYEEAARCQPFEAGEARRSLRASVMIWLCTSPVPRRLLEVPCIRLQSVDLSGCVDLSYQDVVYAISLDDCRIEGALRANNAKLRALMLRGSRVIRLEAQDAEFDGDLEISNDSEVSHGIAIDGTRLQGDFFVRGLKVGCPARPGAWGVGTETMQEFERPNEALSAEGATVSGDVILMNLEADGMVGFAGLEVGSQFAAYRVKLENPEGFALDLQSASAEHVILGHSTETESFPFEALGGVNLSGVSIRDRVVIQHATLDDMKGRTKPRPQGDFWALRADLARIDGGLILRDLNRLAGTVYLPAITVKGSFNWLGIRNRERARIVLRSATIGAIRLETESVEPEVEVELDGCRYTDIDRLDCTTARPKGVELSCRALIGLIRGSPEYRAQPYQAAADVLRVHGRAGDATRLDIAKARDPRRLAQMGGIRRVWHALHGFTCGYGHRPWRAVRWAGVAVIVGWILFSCGHSDGYIRMNGGDGAPAASKEGKAEGRHKLSSAMLAYSLDTFIPVVDLNVAERYTIDPGVTKDGKTGTWVLWYSIAHILAGWVIIGMLVAALAGLIRR